VINSGYSTSTTQERNRLKPRINPPQRAPSPTVKRVERGEQSAQRGKNPKEERHLSAQKENPKEERHLSAQRPLGYPRENSDTSAQKPLGYPREKKIPLRRSLSDTLGRGIYTLRYTLGGIYTP